MSNSLSSFQLTCSTVVDAMGGNIFTSEDPTPPSASLAANRQTSPRDDRKNTDLPTKYVMLSVIHYLFKNISGHLFNYRGKSKTNFIIIYGVELDEMLKGGDSILDTA